jgi:hypothetical protein
MTNLEAICPVCEAKSNLESWLETVHRLNPLDELGGGPIEIKQTHIVHGLLELEHSLFP